MLSSILVTEAQHPDFKKLDWENVLTTVADSLLLNAPIEQLPKVFCAVCGRLFQCVSYHSRLS